MTLITKSQVSLRVLISGISECFFSGHYETKRAILGELKLEKKNRCKRVLMAQQNIFASKKNVLIEQLKTCAASRVTRAVNIGRWNIFTFVFPISPPFLSRKRQQRFWADDTIDFVIYRFLTIYAKTLQPAPFGFMFARAQERTKREKTSRSSSCELLERGNNISKYQIYTNSNNKRAATRKKNFLLRFFCFLSFLVTSSQKRRVYRQSTLARGSSTAKIKAKESEKERKRVNVHVR